MIQKLVLRHHSNFKKIIICGTKNELLKYPETKLKTEFYDEESSPIFDPFKAGNQFEQNGDDRQTLIILDDVMSEAFNSQVVNKMFSRGRHLNLSVILILQSFFPQGSGKSLIPMMKNNCSHQLFFKLRNPAEVALASKKLEYDKKSQEFFLNLIKQEVNEKKFGYIIVYMDENNQKARYRSNLLFEDGTSYETVHFR